MIGFSQLFEKGERLSLRQNLNAKRLNFLLVLLYVSMILTGIFYMGIRSELNDPFVNWISIVIPFEQTNNFLEIEDSIESRLELFKIQEISTHHQVDYQFKNLNTDALEYHRGSSIDEQNLLLKRILPENKNQFTNKTIGLIILKDFLLELGYPEDTLFVGMTFWEDEHGPLEVPIPIIAVKETLPTSNSFLFSKNFYYQTIKEGGIYFDNSEDVCLSIYTPIEQKNDISRIITGYYKKTDSSIDLTIQMSQNDLIYPGLKLDILFNGHCFDSNYQLMEELSNLQVALEKNANIELLRLGNYPKMRDYDSLDYSEFVSGGLPPDLFSINFHDLSQVRELKDFLKNWNIPLDDEKVKDKELFDRLQYFIFFFAICILVFSLFGLFLHINNKLNLHFKNIARQIGNYRAMGLQSKDIEKMYFRIVSSFIMKQIGKTILLSFFVIIFCSYTLEILKVISLTHSTYLTIYVSMVSLLSVIVLFITLTSLRIRFKKILYRSPGKLIYS